MNTLRLSVMALATCLLGACASAPTDFGTSVREMKAAQTARPQGTRDGVQEGADPDVVTNAVDGLRRADDPAGSASSGVTIRVGGDR